MKVCSEHTLAIQRLYWAIWWATSVSLLWIHRLLFFPALLVSQSQDCKKYDFFFFSALSSRHIPAAVLILVSASVFSPPAGGEPAFSRPKIFFLIPPDTTALRSRIAREKIISMISMIISVYRRETQGRHFKNRFEMSVILLYGCKVRSM